MKSSAPITTAEKITQSSPQTPSKKMIIQSLVATTTTKGLMMQSSTPSTTARSVIQSLAPFTTKVPEAKFSYTSVPLEFNITVENPTVIPSSNGIEQTTERIQNTQSCSSVIEYYTLNILITLVVIFFGSLRPFAHTS